MKREIRAELETKLPRHVLEWLNEHFKEHEQILEELQEIKWHMQQGGGALGFRGNFRPDYPQYPQYDNRRQPRSYYDDNRDVERDSRRTRGNFEPMKPIND